MRLFLIYLNMVQYSVITGLCFKLKAYSDHFKRCDELFKQD